MKHTKITAVFGTRPEAIKMCPLISELKRREGITLKVILSGQHRELCREVTDYFGIFPDVDLNIMSHAQTLFDLTEKILTKMSKELQNSPPDVLLVHGDTATAFASALAAFYLGIKIGHVEAGLRSGDLFSPYPEEFYRRSIDAMSFFHFSPTNTAMKNLLFEGITPERIFVTGNTVVDALEYTKKEHNSSRSDEGVLLLMTLHRRENRGDGIDSVLRAVKRAAEHYPALRVVFPVHPAGEVRDSVKILDGVRGIELIDPLPLSKFHSLLRDCDLILSDSGGITEEAIALHKPLLLARDTTERPEGLSFGGMKLVGTDEDKVYTELSRLIESKEARNALHSRGNPFGDGHASERISDILLSFFS